MSPASGSLSASNSHTNPHVTTRRSYPFSTAKKRRTGICCAQSGAAARTTAGIGAWCLRRASYTFALVNLDELRLRVDAAELDTVLLAFCDMQGRLQGKRLTARHFVDVVAEHGAEGCNYLLAVDVEMNTVDGYRMASWDRGYGDFTLRPDLTTLRLVPWHEATAMCMCDLCWGDGAPVVASPRQGGAGPPLAAAPPRRG